MGQTLSKILALILLPCCLLAATSRQTPTSPVVRTYGVAGNSPDFTSLATWESATDNDLVTATAGEILDCRDDAVSFDDVVVLSGATTSATFYRLIRPATGQGHDGTVLNGFTIISTTDVDCIQVQEDNSKIQDLLIRLNINGTAIRAAIELNNTGNEVVGCIVFDNTNAGTGTTYGGRHNASSTTSGFINCSFQDGDGRGSIASTGFFYNCTAVNNVLDGFDLQNALVTLKNCVSDGNGQDYDRHETLGVGVNCYGDQATNATNFNSNTNNQANTTFTFINAGADDYRLASGSDGADAGDGVDLSADGVFAFDDDIFKGTGNMGGSVSGQLWNDWNIGVWEPNPAAGRRILMLF